MISLYFGLPGAGKTTLLTRMMKEAIKSKTYDNVYCNIDVNIEGYWKIYKGDLGVYDLHNGLILYDESMLDFDSRDYKRFEHRLVEFFMKHRHDELDVALFSQNWDMLDRKIRVITDRVYYMYKPILTGFWFTRYYRIPYDIIIPDPNKTAGEKLGEIVQGYCKPNPIARIFCHRVFRPKYYALFDSFERPKRPALPDDRYVSAIHIDNKKKKPKKAQKRSTDDIEIVAIDPNDEVINY